MEDDNTIKIWWAGGHKSFNYGDALGPYLVEKISGKKPVLTPKTGNGKVHLVIGSIINSAGTTPNCIVWGCGVIHSAHTAQKGATFHAVRGPYTRKSLLRTGHQCPEVYGDPALLLPRYYQPKVEKEYELGIIPHYVDYDRVKNEVTDKSINVIDFRHPDIEATTDEIFKCKRIISSSLHGIIVSQSYDIPAVWVMLSNKLTGDGVKFYDYFASVRIPQYKPLDLTKNLIPDKQELINFVDNNKHISNITFFDGDKLLNACPFK